MRGILAFLHASVCAVVLSSFGIGACGPGTPAPESILSPVATVEPSEPPGAPAATASSAVVSAETESVPDAAALPDHASPSSPASLPVAPPPPDPAPPEPPLRTATGIGLWPRTYDIPGMQDALEKTAAVSDVGLLQVTLNWDTLRGDPNHQTYRSRYGYLIEAGGQGGGNLFDHYRLGKAIWIDFLVCADRRSLNLTGYQGTPAFTSPEVADAYIADCVWLADYFQPRYIALGTEVDEYLRHVSAAERAALLRAFSDARDQIKSRHPDVVVFVYFQYENVRARGLWELIRPFVHASDLTAFSSYPSLPFPGPGHTAGTLPGDYFAAIAGALPGAPPTALVELGHPAAASALFGAGSPREQESMLSRLWEVVPRDTVLIVWSHLYDPDYGHTHPADVAQYFGSMGLLRRTGDPESAAWMTWSRRCLAQRN